MAFLKFLYNVNFLLMLDVDAKRLSVVYIYYKCNYIGLCAGWLKKQFPWKNFNVCLTHSSINCCGIFTIYFALFLRVVEGMYPCLCQIS